MCIRMAGRPMEDVAVCPSGKLVGIGEAGVSSDVYMASWIVEFDT